MLKVVRSQPIDGLFDDGTNHDTLRLADRAELSLKMVGDTSDEMDAVESDQEDLTCRRQAEMDAFPQLLKMAPGRLKLEKY